MVAVGGVPEAALHGVAHQAGMRTGACRVHPEPRLSLLQESIYLLLCDAGLYRDVGQVFIEVEDPVHPPQVHQNGAARARDARAVAPIAAAADRVHGNSPLIGDSQDLLHILAIARADDSGHGDSGFKSGGLRRAQASRVEDDILRAEVCLPMFQRHLQMGVGPDKRGSGRTQMR